MKIELKEILLLQKKLDENIHQKHNINPIDVLKKRKLALIVEVCEMINVNRCFKFWSVKSDYDKDKLGDEFVDCLHFILSLSLHYKLDNTEFEIKEEKYTKEQLTTKTLELIECGLKINSKQDCSNFIIKLFELAYTFGFSANDIINYYIKKNEVNFQRQKDNY